MLVLALDTTTRVGSHALVCDGQVVALGTGDASRPHAVRLPGDVLDALGAQGLRLDDVDLFAVAAGPGSFTGLRIGIASMQGLAFSTGRPIVGVSALEGLAATGAEGLPAGQHVAAFMDALRGEVFAALFAVEAHGPLGPVLREEDAPFVAAPGLALDRWRERGLRGACFVGDGAVVYRHLLEGTAVCGAAADPPPPIAPALARIALAKFQSGGTFHPHAVEPIYVRRPDAELARERKAGR
jgi:tRNA threonylcarbamoyladenosine biosynthesis protein TsaB